MGMDAAAKACLKAARLDKRTPGLVTPKSILTGPVTAFFSYFNPVPKP